MHERLVLVLETPSLLMAGVVSLLREQANLKVLAVARDDPHYREKIAEFAAEVVVFDGDDPSLDERLSLAELFRLRPDVLAIAVSAHGERIAEIRPRRTVRATGADLLSAINAA